MIMKNGEGNEFMEDLKYYETIIPLGRYRHFKGSGYEVIALARNSETGETVVVYKALYGDGDVWVRPASMWNETVVRDGLTYKRFYSLERIERVERYEKLYDAAIAFLENGESENNDTLNSSDSHSQMSIEEELHLLEAYYTSGQWLQDYIADENGELPPNLKRGVLSQDGLFNLLEAFSEEE